MAELKTKPSKHNVARFLAAIGDETVRQDCRTLVKIMGQATHRRPTMWERASSDSALTATPTPAGGRANAS